MGSSIDINHRTTARLLGGQAGIEVTPYCCRVRKSAASYDGYEPVRAVPLGAIFCALADFITAGVKPQTPLARAIVLVLILKLIGIAGIKDLPVSR